MDEALSDEGLMFYTSITDGMLMCMLTIFQLLNENMVKNSLLYLMLIGISLFERLTLFLVFLLLLKNASH